MTIPLPRLLLTSVALVTMLATPPTSPIVHAQAGPVVILAPHPDDETLGCGGLIALRAHEGRRVVVVVITDGRALLKRFGVERDPTPAEVSVMRKNETRRAVDILSGGSAEIIFLDFENEGLLAQRAAATRKITALLSELRPGEVYMPSPFEGHAEHVAVNEMAREACSSSNACPSTFEFMITLKRGVTPESVPRRVIGVNVAAHRETERRALQEFRSHLDIIYAGQPAPFETNNYERYLTEDEPFLVER